MAGDTLFCLQAHSLSFGMRDGATTLLETTFEINAPRP